MTFSNATSKILPQSAIRRLQPKWRFFSKYGRRLWNLYFKQGGSIRRSGQLACWVVQKSFNNVKVFMPVRSYPEFRRVVSFGWEPNDLVYYWIKSIRDCEVLYDIGAANGHEGLVANALHGCRVIYIEMSTTSVETLLKGVVLASEGGDVASEFDIVQAACDSEERYSKVFLHNPPVAGSLSNSFDNPDVYGRKETRVWATQWTPSVTIDGLHRRHGLPVPTHVKMDIDGFEARAIEGAKETLASKLVRSWIIEVNPGRREIIDRKMRSAGYIDICSSSHHPGTESAEDHIYARADLVDQYKDWLKTEGWDSRNQIPAKMPIR